MVDFIDSSYKGLWDKVYLGVLGFIDMVV